VAPRNQTTSLMVSFFILSLSNDEPRTISMRLTHSCYEQQYRP